MKIKKLLIALLSMVCLCGVSALVSCGGEDTKKPTHICRGEYFDDVTHHWMICKICNEPKAKEEHKDDGKGSCSVCSYPVAPTAGIVYALSSDGTYAEVVKYDSKVKRVRIADTYEGVPVKGIRKDVFKDKFITEITLPGSITSIGSGAFTNCTKLEKVYIEDLASWCSISFGNTESNPIYHAKKLYLNNELISALNIPNGVTELSAHAFVNCETITSVQIPSTVTSVRASTFTGCVNLQGVYITDIVAWSQLSFESADGNPLYYARKLYLNGELVTDWVIPEEITSIGSYVFAYCENMRFNEANGCKYLGKANNPYYAFVEPKDRTATTYTIHENTEIIADSAFAECEVMESIVIPDSVYSIGKQVFYSCDNLLTVKIGDNVKTIDDKAFFNCRRLESIKIPDSVTTLGERVFYNCKGMVTAVIGEGIKTLTEYTFFACDLLENVVISSSVTSIKSYVFNGCPNMTNVYYKGDAAAWKKITVGAFNPDLMTSTIYYYNEETSSTTLTNWYYDTNGEIVVW